MIGGHLPELIILLVAALVIFGPKRLPEIGGAMGKGIREFRKHTAEDVGNPGDHQVTASERPPEIGSSPPVDAAHVPSSSPDAAPSTPRTDVH